MTQNLLLFIFFLSARLFGGVAITGNYDKAIKAAKAYLKPVAIVYDEKLLEAIESDEFFAVIKESIAFVKSNAESSETRILILDSEEREIGKVGSLPLNNRELGLHLRTLVNGYEAVMKGMEENQNLEILYQDAKRVGCFALADRILSSNIESGASTTLLLESYEKGNRSLKEKILSRGNPEQIRQMKVFDIQVAMKEKKAPEEIAKMKGDDSDWKMQLLLGEYYKKCGKSEKGEAVIKAALEKADL